MEMTESRTDLKDNVVDVETSSDYVLEIVNTKKVENKLGPNTRVANECDICLKQDNHNIADKYCFVCIERLCQACYTVHKSFKASRDHKVSNIDDLVKTELCEPCKYRSKERTANYFCKDCEEFLCSDCRLLHQQMKFAQHHSVILAEEQSLQKWTKTKLYCEICIENNEENEAIAFCLDCNQQKILCSDCVQEHTTFKKTRQHRIEQVKNHRANETISKSQSSEPKLSKEPETPPEDMISDFQPGTPTIYGVEKTDSVLLRWTPPRRLYQEHQYQIRYKTISPSDKWKFYQETFGNSTVVLERLKSDSTFIFQVRMINNDKEGPYSSQSDPISTKQSAAIRLKSFAEQIKHPGSIIDKRKLPLEESRQARNANAKTRQFYLGPNKINCKEKTIMMVGATGSGKSTLVDGITNYVLGVNWDDPFRFTLFGLEEDEIQAFSQTQWITTYCINPPDGSRLNYRLNIIDTPGFGDTRGPERDAQIVDQIRELLSASDSTGVGFLDAVCFVTKAQDARLTPKQNYIFNAILSLFGQDIADNIKILITFADGKAPPVLAALEQAKLPHKPCFPFNNSCLFSDNCGQNMSLLSPMFWEMGCNSFKAFFDHLKTIQTKSLKQTKEVLLKRQKIEQTIENLMPLVSEGLKKMDEFKGEINIIEQYQTEIEANKDFQYTVTETRQVKHELPRGRYVLNCLHCHFTCHKNCDIPRDEDKRRCVAMDDDGKCTQCPEKCDWTQHASTPYIFDYITVQVIKKYREREEKYRKAEGEKMHHEKVIHRLKEELTELQTDILTGMNVMAECSNDLKEIALRPNPLSVNEHIDLLIEAEKQEKREGFLRRINSLMECRKKMEIGDDVKRLLKEFQMAMGNSVFEAENIENILKRFLKKFMFWK